MAKNKITENNISQITESSEIPLSEYPSSLINKLCAFYSQYPDYKTGIVDITVLSYIVHTELNKFVHRPHKKVTEIYLDREAPEHFVV